MVLSNRIHEVLGKAPLFAEQPADVGMIEPQPLGLAVREHQVVALDLGQHAVIFIAEHGVQGEHADVLHERRDEGLIGVARAGDPGDASRRRRRVHRAPPVVHQVELALALTGHVHEAEPKHDRLHRGEPQVGQRPLDRRARLREGVVAGVDRREDLRRERLVVLDHQRDVAYLNVRVACQVQQLHRDRWKSGKLRRVEDLGKSGGAHRGVYVQYALGNASSRTSCYRWLAARTEETTSEHLRAAIRTAPSRPACCPA